MKKFDFVVLLDDNEVAAGKIEIDQSVLDQGLSDEFKKYFYTFEDEAAVAAHIAWRLVVWDEPLSEIEGFMMDRGLAKIKEWPTGWNDFEFRATPDVVLQG